MSRRYRIGTLMVVVLLFALGTTVVLREREVRRLRLELEQSRAELILSRAEAMVLVERAERAGIAPSPPVATPPAAGAGGEGRGGPAPPE